MLKYGFTASTNKYIDPDKVIDRDLKVCPWLKVFNYNDRKLEITYIDEIHGDLWKRCVNMQQFALIYAGRLVDYCELIKEEQDNAQKA